MKISKAAYDVIKDELDWWVEYHTRELIEAKEKISTGNYDSKNLLKFTIPSNKKNLAIANEILDLLEQLEIVEFKNLEADLSVMNQTKNVELTAQQEKIIDDEAEQLRESNLHNENLQKDRI